MSTRAGATRRAVLQAWRAGAEAGRKGEPLSACPYRLPLAVRERLMALWWVRGWHEMTASRTSTRQPSDALFGKISPSPRVEAAR